MNAAGPAQALAGFVKMALVFVDMCREIFVSADL